MAYDTQKKKKNNRYINYFEGFLTQILNSKVSLFYLAAFPQFVDFEHSNHWDAFLLVFVHALTIFLWFLFLSFFLLKLKSLTKNRTFGIWMQRFSGSLLVYFGALVATKS